MPHLCESACCEADDLDNDPDTPAPADAEKQLAQQLEVVKHVPIGAEERREEATPPVVSADAMAGRIGVSGGTFPEPTATRAHDGLCMSKGTDTETSALKARRWLTDATLLKEAEPVDRQRVPTSAFTHEQVTQMLEAGKL